MQRCTLLIILGFILIPRIQGQTNLDSTRISIAAGNYKVEDLFDMISQQSGIDFSYNSQWVEANRRLYFGIDNATLEKTLDDLLAKLDLEYVLIDNQIVLQKREGALLATTVKIATYTISGYILDELTGESLIGATVSVDGGSRGTITNAFGYYTLQLAEGNYRLIFSYVGYQLIAENIQLGSDLKKDVVLTATPLQLPGILVSVPFQSLMNKQGLGQVSLRPDVLSGMPEFGGESGLIKGLQALPGIKMHSDGSAFFYTRGGEKDQNLIIIDDAPIFNPAHLFGFYSMVIPDFTKEIQVYKSDIPVSLGDRLSSIISIRTKDGNLNKWGFSGSLNPLINRFSVEIPTAKTKGSIFTSFRRSNFEWIYKKENPDLKLEFGDFNFKWNHKFNANNRVFFTLITGVDALDNQVESSSGISWGNVAMTLRWNHIFGPRLFSNTTIYSGSYNYRLQFVDNSWESGIGMASLKTDFTHFINAAVEARFGFEFAGYALNPGRIASGNLLDFLPDINKTASRKRIVYYQVQFQPSKNWELKAGLRLPTWENYGPAEYFTYDENSEVIDTVNQPEGVYRSFTNLDPRISIKYHIDSTSHFKLSYGRYHQYLQLITNSVSPFTSLEVWLPSSPNILPQSANQLGFGFAKFFPKAGLEFALSSYFKKLYNQIDYRPHAQTLLNPKLEGELRFGEMDTYGFEFMLRKRLGRLNGWLNYTWSRALRKTPKINQGLRYPAFQDRPHDFSLLLNYQPSKRILFSTYWTAYTGSTFSSPTGFYTFNDQTVPIYEKKNNDRLPNYRRVDLAFKFRLNKNPENRYQHDLIFSVYNAFFHKNIVAVNFNKVLDPQGDPVIKANFLNEQNLVATQTDLVRFLPSLTYKFKLL